MPAFDNPFEPEPDEKPDLSHFPYYQLYKVRNMRFALDIPVFTALESQEHMVKDGYCRFEAIYCCN